MSALLAEATHARPSLALRDTESAIPVLVFAKDPISRAGVTGQLRAMADITMLEPGDDRHPEVAVVVVDAIDDEVVRVVKTIRRSLPKVVVIASIVDDAAVASAVDAGVSRLLARAQADHQALATAIRKARWGDSVPTVTTVQPLAAVSRPDFSRAWETTNQALNARDRDVLRFLAEGYDTAEIARRLAYSEPTIKNVIQRLFEQLQARNRPHAVAIALRAGII